MANWIKGGILFVAGGIAQRFLDKFLDWSESELLPKFLYGVSLSDVLLIVMISIGGLLIVVGMLKARRDFSKPKTSFDPKFKHVSARLFYTPKRRWHRIRVPTKHWWEIWKQNPSRQKLVLVKDLRKAYWVGEFGWNLIIEHKIEWLSEEKEDLEQWCKKEGYTPFREEVDEEKLLEPYFHAEIVNKKTKYRHGDSVLFRTSYRGKLVNRFFDNEIVFPDERKSDWCWAHDTLETSDPNMGGKLNGYVNHESSWNWRVPLDAPVGKYRVCMRVYNHLGFHKRPVADKAETKDVFTVV